MNDTGPIRAHAMIWECAALLQGVCLAGLTQTRSGPRKLRLLLMKNSVPVTLVTPVTPVIVVMVVIGITWVTGITGVTR